MGKSLCKGVPEVPYFGCLRLLQDPSAVLNLLSGSQRGLIGQLEDMKVLLELMFCNTSAPNGGTSIKVREEPRPEAVTEYPTKMMFNNINSHSLKCI